MNPFQTAASLEALVRAEVVLHGSSQCVKVLEPHPAFCAMGEPEKNDLGIYATRDVEVALIKALVRPRSPWGYRYGEPGTFFVDGQVGLQPGYVYVCDQNEFEHIPHSRTWIAKKQVRPEWRIFVTPEILTRFPGIVFEALGK